MTPTPDPPDTPAADAPEHPPVLRIVRGHPTEAEVAALVTVLAAATTAAAAGSGPGDPAPAHTPSAWTARDRLARAPHHPHPGGWRASAFPA